MMNETSGEAQQTVSIPQALLRRWWLVIGTPFLTGVLAIAFVFVVTPVFAARATNIVESILIGSA